MHRNTLGLRLSADSKVFSHYERVSTITVIRLMLNLPLLRILGDYFDAINTWNVK